MLGTYRFRIPVGTTNTQTNDIRGFTAFFNTSVSFRPQVSASFPTHTLSLIAIRPFVALQPELLRASSNKQQIYIYIINVCVCACVCLCVWHKRKMRIRTGSCQPFCTTNIWQHSCFVWVRNIAWKIKFWMNFRPCFCGINRLTHKMYVSSIFTPFWFHENRALRNCTT